MGVDVGIGWKSRRGCRSCVGEWARLEEMGGKVGVVGGIGGKVGMLGGNGRDSGCGWMNCKISLYYRHFPNSYLNYNNGSILVELRNRC